MVKKCFLICPIGKDDSDIRKHSDMVMKHLITPVCNSKEYEVIRGDLINSANKIDDDIINHLENDELAIADLTGCNPNVFYEIGYRSAIGRTTVYIAEKGTEFPFDTNHIRTIPYNLKDLDSVEDFKHRLSATIESLPENQNDSQTSKPDQTALRLPEVNVY